MYERILGFVKLLGVEFSVSECEMRRTLLLKQGTNKRDEQVRVQHDRGQQHIQASGQGEFGIGARVLRNSGPAVRP